MERLIADTGFFVALGRSSDPCHSGARAFIERFQGQLVTTSPIVVETCHFLNSRSRCDLLEWIHDAGPSVAEVPVDAFPDLCVTIRKFANRDIDFADASLVWLAEQTGLRKILTVDTADFSLFRLKGGKRFQLVDWA